MRTRRSAFSARVLIALVGVGDRSLGALRAAAPFLGLPDLVASGVIGAYALVASARALAGCVVWSVYHQISPSIVVILSRPHPRSWVGVAMPGGSYAQHPRVPPSAFRYIGLD